MTLGVLLFGPLADAAGATSVAVSVPNGATVAEILRAIAATSPALQPHVPACRLAVNAAFASDNEPVHESDELALIGLVGGG